MIVAITGGTGFIGKKLAQHHLSKGDTVRLLSRRPPPESLPQGLVWYRGGLLDVPAELTGFAAGADVLYHCAGEIRDKTRMEAVNTEGTRNLAMAAAGNIGRWVQLSSVGSYGAFQDGVVTEDTPLQPVGPYETSKARADELVVEASGKGAFPFSMLRPSNVYGPDMSNQSLFQMINMIDRGLFFFVGEPGASANYVHVANVVDGLIKCGSEDAALNRIYNLSDYCDLELLVSYICRGLGKRPPQLRLPLQLARWLAKLASIVPAFPLTASRVNALTNRSRYSTLRIEKEIGYVATVTLEAGMQEMVAAWKMTRQHAS